MQGKIWLIGIISVSIIMVVLGLGVNTVLAGEPEPDNSTFPQPVDTYTTLLNEWEEGGKTYKSIVMSGGPANYEVNGTFYRINGTIYDVDVTLSNRQYINGVETGLYYAYFRETSSDVSTRPVAMRQNNYVITFAPQDYVTLSPSKPTKNGYVGNRQQSDVIVEGDQATYPNQYKEIDDSEGFANLTFNYYNTRLKEELVIWNQTYLQERFNSQCDDADFMDVNMEFDTIIRAYYDEDWDNLTLGAFYGNDRVKFKDFGMQVNDEINTQERIDFTDINNNTVFFVPKLYARDSNNSEILLNKTLKMTSFGNLRVIIQTPFWWLNSSDRVYPVKVDPPVSVNLSGKNVMEDSYGIKSIPDDNYGSITNFNIYNNDDSDIRRSIIRINLSTIVEDIDEITSAKFEVETDLNRASMPGIGIFGILDALGWSESTVTYNNQPCGNDDQLNNTCNQSAVDTQTPPTSSGDRKNWTITGIMNDPLKESGGKEGIIEFMMNVTVKNANFYNGKSSENAGSDEPQLYLTYTESADATPPTLNLDEPQALAYNISVVTLNYTHGDDVAVDQCIRELDGVNTTITNCVNQSMGEDVLGEGSHTLRLWVNDTTNNKAVDAVTFTFTHNILLNASMNKTATLPQYNQTEDVNVSGRIGWFNLTTIQGANSNVTINWLNTNNDSVQETNFTPSVTGIYFDDYTLNQTADLGVWWIVVTGWTTQNDTTTRSIVNQTPFNVSDETVPSIIFDEPQALVYNISVVRFNYSVGDNYGLDTCTRELDGVNTTIAGCVNQSLGEDVLGEGSHTLRLWVNDTTNNVNVSSVTFTFTHDLLLNATMNKTATLPQYNQTEDVNVSGRIGWFNLTTIQGANSNVSIRWLNSGNGTVREVNFTPSTAGIYFDNFTLNQTADLGVWWVVVTGWTTQNDTTTRSILNQTPFNVSDETVPTIILNEPQALVYNISVVTLNYSVGDVSNIDTCIRELDSVNTTITGCVNQSMNEELLGEGSHTLRLWVNDSLNNINVSSVSFSFTHDLYLNTTFNRSGSPPDYNASQQVNVSGFFSWFNETTIDGSTSNITILWKNSNNDTLQETNFTPQTGGLYWDEYVLNLTPETGTYWVDVTGFTLQNGTERAITNTTPFTVTGLVFNCGYSYFSREYADSVLGREMLLNASCNVTVGGGNVTFTIDRQLTDTTNINVIDDDGVSQTPAIFDTVVAFTGNTTTYGYTVQFNTTFLNNITIPTAHCPATATYLTTHCIENITEDTSNRFEVRFEINVTDELVSNTTLNISMPLSIFTDFDSANRTDTFAYINGSLNDSSVVTNGSHVIVVLGTSHTASSLHTNLWTVAVNYTITVESGGGGGGGPITDPGAGGGGGGGATAFAVCGNGICEPAEGFLTCPEDCGVFLVLIENQSFVVNPINIIYSLSTGDTQIKEIIASNLADVDIPSVTAQIEQIGSDPSFNWASIEVMGEDTVPLQLPGQVEFSLDAGSTVNPTRKILRLTVTPPQNTEFADYRFNVKFNAGGVEKTVFITVMVREFPSPAEFIFNIGGYIESSLSGSTGIPNTNIVIPNWLLFLIGFIVLLLIIILAATRRKKK